MTDAQLPNPLEAFENLLKAGQKVLGQFQQIVSPKEGLSGSGFMWPMEMFEPLGNAAQMQSDYFARIGLLWNSSIIGAMTGGRPTLAQPEPGDKRFNDKAWREEPFYDLLKQSYLLGSRYLNDFVEGARVDQKTKLQLRFYARQMADAMSPSNYAATNPEVLRTAVETRFESLQTGMQSLMKDMQRGQITMTDETAFEIGGTLAITPGSVIFENELIQLIQYAPQTARVEKTPLLIVPPCINKFYIFDLQPKNSFVRFAVGQGHNVFLISWRNATAETAHLTWEDYVESGVLTAIDVVSNVAKSPTLHALGFCIGGTLLGCMAAVLAARKDERLASITLLNTMLDFCDTGEIGIMVNEPYVRSSEAKIGSGGILSGKELAFIFSTLRANDLIWSNVVKNYLKGASPDAFDMLYWNADAVNLPGPMYCWYIRNAYLENNLKIPGKVTLCGAPIDLNSIKAPLYALAAQDDHIVLWKTSYESMRHVGGKVRFVLGASGHIAGVINPVSRNKRNYWTNEELLPTSDDWLTGAKEMPGSWWPDWDRWLKDLSKGTIPAPTRLGDKDYPVIEPAPGRYVKMKAV